MVGAGKSKTSRKEEQKKLQLVVAENGSSSESNCAPIISSYNDRIRPLLDAVDRLRNMKIMQEGIQLPTIVVVGDQSSGKSSVLESLAGISLPRGQGISTRVPLVMRLQSHSSPDLEMYLEYDGNTVPTDEEDIADAISLATDRIAGPGKGVSGTPLTLVVKKIGVPNLTLVDLPGITRVPVNGQPDDIYEQISAIIMEYITPEESIILNVLSASVDFTTCESIRMARKVKGASLAVVTKCDKAPEGLLEKITSDDVNIGLGYVCVRNRIGDESFAEARAEEAVLFQNHPLLSKISKSMVGIPVLAEKLMHIQSSMIAKAFPDIVRKISAKLSANVEDLNKLPRNLDSLAEAMTAFMHILGSAKESLRKLMLRGEFDEYPDVKEMHSTARLAEMLDEEARAIGLPNFLPRIAFLTLLQRKVSLINTVPLDFVDSTWLYIENVIVKVMTAQCDKYPQLQSSWRCFCCEGGLRSEHEAFCLS